MAEKMKISTPAGSAGIFRFYDEEGGGIKISPELVVGITIVFVVSILILQFALK